MSKGLSPLVSLATSMQSQRGVYALLLGSGVSTGAGLLTGWGVVGELVARVAAAADPGDADGVAAARADPEAWWTAHEEGDLGYSTLLERLAPTAAARQGVLSGFFEPGTEEDEQVRQPSRAHHAIAQLVLRGIVRVIITTNFDRLMEQALEAVGISPQVISRPEAVNGMAPLAHARATVIKLHGDYKDLGSRNTPTELSEYPAEWIRLLRQVFDEYGLVVSGWSADWDTALVRTLEETSSRRYPLYWDERSSRGTGAQRLLAVRGGTVMPASSADELFTELSESVEAIDRMLEAPMTTGMAVAQLKKYLPDPVRRIDLHDLVMDAVDDVVDFIAAQPVSVPGGGGMTSPWLEELYDGYFTSMDHLAQLLIAGVRHDDDGTHTQLWVDVVQRLVDAGASLPSSFVPLLRSARLIPAFVALTVISITATRRNREGLLLTVAMEVEAQLQPGYNDPRLNAAQILHHRRVIENDQAVSNLPKMTVSRWLYPVSHFFATETRRYLTNMIPVDEDFDSAYRGFEYRLGLIQGHTVGYKAITGEYVGEWAWRGEEPITEIEFRNQAARGRAAEWTAFFEERQLTLDAALTAHRTVLERYRIWG